MAEQISADNTKKVLLEGNGSKAAPQPRPIRQQRKMPSDVVVENATEKRYLWTARAFAIVFAVSLCCNFILTYVIMSVIPLYRVEPYLFSFANKTEQIYNIEQVDKIYEYKYLTEIFVREYVLLRNTYINDLDEMERRWGDQGSIREMSSNKVYATFQNKEKTPAMNMIRERNLTRTIKIASVNEVGGSGGANWWQVEIRAEDMTPEYETPRVSTYVVNVQIMYRAKRVMFGERLKNPLGFTVVGYRTLERKN